MLGVPKPPLFYLLLIHCKPQLCRAYGFYKTVILYMLQGFTK